MGLSNEQRAVLLDALEQMGERDCDIARWIAEPDAVRLLLAPNPTRPEAGEQVPTEDAYSMEYACAACGSDLYAPHDADCIVLAAWHAIGDERWQRNIDACESLGRQRNDVLDRLAARGLTYTTATHNDILRATWTDELLDASVYADNPLLAMLPKHPPILSTPRQSDGGLGNQGPR